MRHRSYILATKERYNLQNDRFFNRLNRILVNSNRPRFFLLFSVFSLFFFFVWFFGYFRRLELCRHVRCEGIDPNGIARFT